MKTNTTAGQAVQIRNYGVQNGLSSLTIGANVYLSDTPGAVSSSVGTYIHLIGLGLSATEALISPESRKPNTILTGLEDGQFPAGTFYASFGARWKTATEAVAQIPVPFTGMIKNLHLYIFANTVTATTNFTLRKGGANTALTIAVGAGATGAFSDITHAVKVVAGDLITMKIASSDSGNNIDYAFSIEIV